MVYIPDTVAPAPGAMSATVGGVVSDVLLLTVTLIDALAELFAASRAVAVMVWEPLLAVVVSHKQV